MRYVELVQLYFDRSNALQGYWTLYVVIIGGLLAFSSLRQRPDVLTALLVTVLYCCFAYKNLGAIHDASEQRRAILSGVESYVPPAPEAQEVSALRGRIEPTLSGPASTPYRAFHLAADLLTLAAVWAMEWRRRRFARPMPPSNKAE